ncbi:MAG TPA: type IV secretory system conjugative DNA transfer family protein [Acidimicrobiales bacterium]|nr:type IV secretory system conjugative DNA transfer family protein [Acidimicrobiales bacterium]
MSGLLDTLLPIALGATVFAGISSRHDVAVPGWRPRGRRRDRGARWARRSDLGPLLTGRGVPTVGRLTLGTVGGAVHRSRVVSEAGQSVVVVGPTQSGKTTALAVPAIMAWEGPVVAASVKSDLLRHTLGRRSACGRVWCIDPTGSTGHPTSGWSPLTDCAEWAVARRMAFDLAETAKSDTTTSDGEFWYATAAKLLAPLLFAAARDNRSMVDVVRWVDTQEVSEVSFILEQAGVPEALDAARASWCRDERTRSSVYTTAETVLAPFIPLATGAPPQSWFDARVLLGGSNTLYLCAPAHDQRRLRGYFNALTHQVLSQAFTFATFRGRPLHPPLLVVLDEAAHIAPLPELDGLAATCASHGIQLVTVWQDLAQVRARYGSRAPTVLNNHRAKLFLPGIADPDTLEYASRLIGEEEVSQPSVTRDRQGGRSTTTATGPRRLLPPEDLRCLQRGEAVLVYGSLPPVRLRLRPWWAELHGRHGAARRRARRLLLGGPPSRDPKAQ